jgi:hypothetical protein
VSKVVDYYARSGLVESTPLTLPGHQPNMPVLQHLFLKRKMTHKRQNEVIPYNDCLYRNMYRFRYVALLDVDEVIVPAQHRTWADMMAGVEQQAAAVSQQKRASFHFQNVYFFDEVRIRAAGSMIYALYYALLETAGLLGTAPWAELTCHCPEYRLLKLINQL